MKQFFDRGRSDQTFQVGDMVYLKLQPYRQHSVRRVVNQKLFPKFFSHFVVKAKVGKVAYRLHLPLGFRIHPAFHVSKLAQSTLPPVGPDGAMLNELSHVLERCMVRRGNQEVIEVLIEWANTFPEDATWEVLHELQQQFPTFDP
ncbi:reverse transcriptase [Gossypium australe]|uniref:Reverse transcriptase n=1 Tax=Gossypium australe TaxID=47621 RepID=A0A5B6WX80_9ROSI|nr:reverse transcriptase [Gossypium australe]